MTQLPNLVVLSLGHNAIGGELLDTICGLSKLEALLLNSAQLSGPIPTCLDQMPRLKYLWLAGNALTGPAPSVLCGGNTSARLPLVQIDLSHNQLSGNLPSSAACWSQLANLRLLDLSSNAFNGTLDNHQLGKMAQLEVLKLKNNRFTGTMLWGDLPFMQYLMHVDVSSNELSSLIQTDSDWCDVRIFFHACSLNRSLSLSLFVCSFSFSPSFVLSVSVFFSRLPPVASLSFHCFPIL